MTDRNADYIISGGLVVRGSGVTREDIVVKDGKIQADSGKYRREDAARIIDASGLYVMPGIVDAHNHPVYADRIETFSLSAAFGGIFDASSLACRWNCWRAFFALNSVCLSHSVSDSSKIF